MLEAISKILPILAIFALGYSLKKAKVFKPEDGGVLLKLIFYVIAPALIYLSTSTVKITGSLLMFPAIAAISMMSIYLLDILVTKNFKVSPKTLGVYMVGTLIANTGFALPFLLATFGTDVVPRVAMFDLAGGVLTYSFVYSIAVKYGDKKLNSRFMLYKVLASPPLWATLLGLLANFFSIQSPEVANIFLKTISQAYTVLVMLALGFYFSPKILKPTIVFAGVITRMVGGFAIGYILSSLLGLTGLDKVAAIICTSAPIGYNTLTFSNLENLDIEFAASLVSIALAAGIILIPVLTVVLT